jgi:hypothetical protein
MKARPAAGLVLDLLHAPPGSGDAGRTLAALDASARAELLAELRRHGLSGWAHLACARTQPALPPDLADPLRSDHLANTARAVIALSQYDRISRLLSQAGLAHVPLKGARLLETIYPDLGARELVDLDLLVRREELDAADRLLRGAGFAGPSGRRREHEARHGVHLQYRTVGPQPPVTLDLHWRLSYRFALRRPPEALWRTSRPSGRVDSPAERVLDEAAELLGLLVHLADHWSAFRLKWLLDLRLLLDRAVPDAAARDDGRIGRGSFPERVAGLAADWGTLAVGYHGLWLVHRATGSTAAAAVRDAVGRRLSPLRRTLLALGARPERFLDGSWSDDGRRSAHAAGLWLADDAREAVRFVGRLATAKLHVERLLR